MKEQTNQAFQDWVREVSNLDCEVSSFAGTNAVEDVLNKAKILLDALQQEKVE